MTTPSPHADHPNLTVVEHPLVQHKLTLMREKDTSSSSFRQLLREISMLMAYEATRDLELTTRSIETPMEPFEAPILAGKKVALISVLRAGNGILDGMLEILPSARIGHVGLFRDEETLRPVEYYCSLPSSMPERDAIVVDPMLATGHSSAAAIARVKESNPKSIRFVALVSAPEGVRHLQEQHPDVRVFTAALDRQLNEVGYILPGLGDAGDRIFGTR